MPTVSAPPTNMTAREGIKRRRLLNIGAAANRAVVNKTTPSTPGGQVHGDEEHKPSDRFIYSALLPGIRVCIMCEWNRFRAMCQCR